MNDSLYFLYIIFFFSIIIHVLAGIITAAFVIPLQYKEAQVKNGLAVLRKQMLIKGILALIIIIVSIIALTARFYIPSMEALRYIITTMIFLHAIGSVGKAIVDYQIYHQQYTPQQKHHHEIIDKLEKGQVKVVPIKKKRS